MRRNLAIMALSQSMQTVVSDYVQLSLVITSSVDLGGVYRAVFDNGNGVTVELQVVGMGSDSASIIVGPSGVISVSVQKTSSPAQDSSSVSISALNPTYSKSDTFNISETISLDSDPGEVAGCTSLTTIDVTISEG